MLFNEKKCEKCSTYYDSALECCPKCKEKNVDVAKYKFSKYLSWLSPLKQLALGMLGSLGYTLISSLVLVIVLKSFKATKADIQITALAISISYLLNLLILGFTVGKDIIKRIWPNMKSLKPYLFGLGIGSIYIVISILYNLFLTNVIKLPSTNSNQSQVIDFVKGYPALAFFIIVLVGPICEELTYRVGIFNLCLRTKRWVAYAVAAVIFGLMHFDFTSSNIVIELWNLPTYILAGVAFGFIYDKYGFAASLSSHVLNNLLSFILTVAQNG